jgi:pimeloyl-ACP methyl ester carboxylesterase
VNASREPLVIAEQGHFFTGTRTRVTEFGTSVTGTHVQFQVPVVNPRGNLVLVHGGGGQALDMLTTPDGREGWATLFLRAGFAVYTVDRPGFGRSPYHPALFSAEGQHAAMGPPATYGSFVASFAGPAPDGLPAHTQWPGDGSAGDPALAQFLAWQEPFPGVSLARMHEDMRDGAAGLLDKIGPSVLLTHSMGGGFGWLAAAGRREAVQAIVAVEPAGPPYASLPGIGSFEHGLTALPLPFGPGEAEGKLDGLPVAFVCAQSSPFGPVTAETAEFLRRCGAAVTEIRLAGLGIHGNGHAMMLEKNNAEVAAVITDWITATTGSASGGATDFSFSFTSGGTRHTFHASSSGPGRTSVSHSSVSVQSTSTSTSGTAAPGGTA